MEGDGAPIEPVEDSQERFVRLFLSEERSIRAFVMSLVPVHHAVDDLVQQSCVVMIRKFASFKPAIDPNVEFRRWACAIAYHEVRNYRRKKGRDHLILSDTVMELLASRQLELDEQAAISTTGRVENLADCLSKLQEFDRRLLALRYAKGMRGNQIAEAVGRSLESVYKRMARAKQRLRDCMAIQVAQG
jgi:RNA polymerase sigma-70 factor (ECF subfamily)